MRVFFFCLLLFSSLGSETIKLKKMKVEEVEARVLSKGKPIDITGEGPKMLKVLTYLLFPDTMKKEEKYNLVLETEEGEKFYSYVTPLSRIKDERGRRYGRGRGFSILVPPGTHHFRLHLFTAPSETCAVKFSFEEIRWDEVKPLVCQREVLLRKNGNLLYYETPVKISFGGGSYKFLARLLSPTRTKDSETLSVVIEREGGPERIVKSAPVWLSPKIKTNRNESVSIVKAFYLDLKEGEYKITVLPKGIVKVYKKR
jgi:hypothetical protein